MKGPGPVERDEDFAVGRADLDVLLDFAAAIDAELLDPGSSPAFRDYSREHLHAHHITLLALIERRRAQE